VAVVKRRLIIAIIGIAIVAVAAVALARRVFRERVQTVTATITQIDPQTRVATIEMVHPKNGRTLQITGTVPPVCEIRIDGRPAELADLRPGDRAEVEGTIHWDMHISANWVRVSRAASATAPLTTRAAEKP